MGLMDPEELSCTEVESDNRNLVISETTTGRHDHLTSEETSSAVDIVDRILDESIEIFNKVDELNLINNNCDGDVSNEVSSDKTDVDRVLKNVDPNINLFMNADSCTSRTVDSIVDYNVAGDSSELLKCDSDSLLVVNDEENKVTSSEESTDSPVETDSESSLSRSPTDNSLCIDKTELIVNKTVLKHEDYGNDLLKCVLNEDEGCMNSSSQESAQRLPDQRFDRFNGFEDDSALQFVQLRYDSSMSAMGKHDLYPEPTLLVDHDCQNHPDVVKLKHDFDRIYSELQVSNGKADRLDECLFDLEKMLDKVAHLEKKICELEMELDLCKQEREKESKALIALRQETTASLDSLKKKFEQANKEKEGMVVRYAKSEKELLDMRKEKTTLLKQIKDQHKENDNILNKLKHISEDKSRLSLSLDNKNMELTTAFKEADRLKEEINTREIKIKWIQNKLLAEMDLHKECPDKIEALNKQIFELEKKLEKNADDIDQYKKTIAELEAIKVLEGQVREEQAKLILERHDQSERVIKMKALQLKTDALIEENNNLSFQVQKLEVERLELDKKLSECRQESQEYANNLADLTSKLVHFDSVSNQLTQERERLVKANEEVERLRKANEELMQDMSTCRSREAEMLSFTQKLTTKNVQLQSEFSNIESRAGELMLEAEKAESTSDILRSEANELKEQLNQERCKREEERNLLAREVAEGRSKISILESQLNETKSNLHASNNKHQALIRELQRELQTCHRRLEQENRATNTMSNSFHADTNPKLNHHGSSSTGPGSTGRSSPANSSSLTSSLNSIPDATIVQPSHHQLEVSPTVLVDRILKLQTDAKNYQDKIEFLEDHNTTLLEELKKKGRLLHSYILREQAGALASKASDKHKMEVSKHGGIMSSVYGSKPTDEGMTLELSLQINHKLQAILEDTLLKNITLKENMETLGDEIARLRKLHPS